MINKETLQQLAKEREFAEKSKLNVAYVEAAFKAICESLEDAAKEGKYSYYCNLWGKPDDHVVHSPVKKDWYDWVEGKPIANANSSKLIEKLKSIGLNVEFEADYDSIAALKIDWK